MGMDWQAIGVGIGTGVALIGANAWVMKLVIDNAVKSALLLIAKDYVTKHDFNNHIVTGHASNLNTNQIS